MFGFRTVRGHSASALRLIPLVLAGDRSLGEFGTEEDQQPMIFRLSQKLCTKIKAGKLSETPLDENPFADWSAHLFVADRTQYIIVSNTKSLYSTVLFAKGITDDSRFIERALS